MTRVPSRVTPVAPRSPNRTSRRRFLACESVGRRGAKGCCPPRLCPPVMPVELGADDRPVAGAVRSRTDRWCENELIEFTRRCSVRERTHETRYTAHTTARITSTTNVTLRACLRCSGPYRGDLTGWWTLRPSPDRSGGRQTNVTVLLRTVTWVQQPVPRRDRRHRSGRRRDQASRSRSPRPR